MNGELRDEILRRVDIDQLHRLKYYEEKQNPEYRTELKRIDRDNTAWLKQVVAQQGWPTISQVGEEASHAVWLLVQHSDLDPAFQEHCLALMQALPDGEVLKPAIAYLEDRVLSHQDKPLKYGTQFVRSADDTHWVPMETEDLEHVDERRLAMGMTTMAENIEALNDPNGHGFSNMPRHRK